MADQAVIEQTAQWVEKVVIGLNLCPFAKAVQVKSQIRYVVSRASSGHALLEALEQELLGLAAADPNVIDTTLLIHPNVLGDFYDYNDFLTEADALLNRLDLEGILQIASFHPRYQFEGSSVDDPANYTNRSPYPLLHLLREASVTRAVEAFPDASSIYERNMATMRALEPAQLAQLLAVDD